MQGHGQQLPLIRGFYVPAVENWRAGFLLILFFSLSLVAGWHSDGVYHEDDLTHYVFARWSQFDARYLLDFWGRPGFTVPYSWPASLGTSAQGLQACRILSAILSAASAWLAFCIARRLGLRHAWTVIPFLYLQPLFARLSLTTLTETPLAFYLALATWLLVSGRLEWSAAIMALAPLTRDEAVALLPLWALAIAIRGGRWWCYPLLLWAIVTHNLLSWFTIGAWPAQRWLEPDGSDEYGHGTLLTFVPKLAYASGPVVVGLAIMGLRRVWRRPQGWVLVSGCIAWFALETGIYMRGAYSSGGYARFLVPICPWLAVLACAGAAPLWNQRTARTALFALLLALIGIFTLCQAEWIWRKPVTHPDWRSWVLAGRLTIVLLCVAWAVCAVRLRLAPNPTGNHSAVLAGTTITLLLLAGLGGFLPLRLTAYQSRLREHAPAILEMAQHNRPILTLNRWFYHWADQWVAWNRWHDAEHLLDSARPGSLFVWDERFCREPGVSLEYADVQSRPGWRLVWASELGPDGQVPSLACFERQTVMQAAKP